MTRKIQKIGNSFFISLPVEFIRKAGLKAGDLVSVKGKKVLKLKPAKTKQFKFGGDVSV